MEWVGRGRGGREGGNQTTHLLSRCMYSPGREGKYQVFSGISGMLIFSLDHWNYSAPAYQAKLAQQCENGPDWILRLEIEGEGEASWLLTTSPFVLATSILSSPGTHLILGRPRNLYARRKYRTLLGLWKNKNMKKIWWYHIDWMVTFLTPNDLLTSYHCHQVWVYSNFALF